MKKYIILFKLLLLFFFIIKPVNAEYNIKAKTAILQDYLSGEILYEKKPNLSIFPASMTKIMTTIIVFDLIKKGDLNLDEKLSFKLECLNLDENFFIYHLFDLYINIL